MNEHADELQKMMKMVGEHWWASILECTPPKSIFNCPEGTTSYGWTQPQIKLPIG